MNGIFINSTEMEKIKSEQKSLGLVNGEKLRYMNTKKFLNKLAIYIG